MLTLHRQVGSSHVGLATVSAIFVGLLLYAQYVGFNNEKTTEAIALTTDQSTENTTAAEVDKSVQHSQVSTIPKLENKRIVNAKGEVDLSSNNAETNESQLTADSSVESVIQPVNSSAIAHQDDRAAVQNLNAQSDSQQEIYPSHYPAMPLPGSDAWTLHQDNYLAAGSMAGMDNRVRNHYRGLGRGQSRGRGDGEFDFNMSFTARSRMQADSDFDGNYEGGQRSHSSVNLDQHMLMHPAYRYQYYAY